MKMAAFNVFQGLKLDCINFHFMPTERANILAASAPKQGYSTRAALAYLDELGYNKSYYGKELPLRPFGKDERTSCTCFTLRKA